MSLYFGSRVSVGRGFHVETDAIVGDDVLISSYVAFISDDHRFDDPQLSVFHQGRTDVAPPIIIESDSLIGFQTVVLGGVRIGRGVIIGAGSLVTCDLPPTQSASVGQRDRIATALPSQVQADGRDGALGTVTGRATGLRLRTLAANQAATLLAVAFLDGGNGEFGRVSHVAPAFAATAFEVRMRGAGGHRRRASLPARRNPAASANSSAQIQPKDSVGTVYIVLERSGSGHRLAYVSLLARHLIRDEWTWATSSQASQSAEAKLHFGSLGGWSTQHIDGNIFSVTIQSLRLARRLNAVLVIPDADMYLVALLALAPVHWGTIRCHLLVMRTAPPRLAPSLANARIFLKVATLRLLRKIPTCQINFLTDCFGVVTKRRGYPGLHPVKDPIEPPVPLGLGCRVEKIYHGFSIGIFGHLTQRKNIDLILAAARSSVDVSIVLAGKIDTETRYMLEQSTDRSLLSAQGRLHIQDELLDDSTLSSRLASVDVVAVLYDNDMPSGIMGRAIAVGTPVIAPNSGWLGGLVRELGIGIGVRLDVIDICRAIDELRRDGSTYKDAVKRAGLRLGTDSFVKALLGRQP